VDIGFDLQRKPMSTGFTCSSYLHFFQNAALQVTPAGFIDIETILCYQEAS